MRKKLTQSHRLLAGKRRDRKGHLAPLRPPDPLERSDPPVPTKSGRAGLCEILLFISIAFAAQTCDQAIVPISNPRGPKWVIYTRSNSPLVSDTINAIFVDFENTKWIATSSGANSYNAGRWQKFTDSLRYTTPFGRSWEVNAITVGADKSVWFGLAGGGIVKLNLFSSAGTRWKRYRAPVINSDFVYSLTTDNLGNIYVGTSSGVSRHIPNPTDPDAGLWYKYTSGNSPIPDEPIRSAGVNPYDNLLWFGTYSHGVVSFDGDLNWNVDTPSEQPFPIISLAFSIGSTIWFGTYADWAYRYSITTSEWTHIADSASGGGLQGNFVNAVAVDRDGNVWFGTNKGLTQFNGSSYMTLTSSNAPLPSDTIKALSVDFNNNLWIGTVNGLAEYNEEGTVP